MADGSPGSAPKPPVPMQPAVGTNGRGGYQANLQGQPGGPTAPQTNFDWFQRGGQQPGQMKMGNPNQFYQQYWGTLNPAQRVAFSQMQPGQQQAQLMDQMAKTWQGGAPGSAPSGYNVQAPGGGTTFVPGALYSQLYGSPTSKAGAMSTANWDQWKSAAGGAVPWIKPTGAQPTY